MNPNSPLWQPARNVDAVAWVLSLMRQIEQYLKPAAVTADLN